MPSVGIPAMTLVCTEVRIRCRKIAVAGRSKSKLTETMHNFGTGAEDIAIIDNVNCNKPGSLLAAACRTHILINCVGPYRHYGEPVVQACVATGTDYLDVCGEPGVLACAMWLPWPWPERVCTTPWSVLASVRQLRMQQPRCRITCPITRARISGEARHEKAAVIQLCFDTSS